MMQSKGTCMDDRTLFDKKEYYDFLLCIWNLKFADSKHVYLVYK